MLLPVSHEDGKVRRLPFITIGIIALSFLFMVFVNPIMETQKDRLLSVALKKYRIIWVYMQETKKALPPSVDAEDLDEKVRRGEYLDEDSEAYQNWLKLDEEYQKRSRSTVYHWLGFIPRRFYRLHTYVTSLFVHGGAFFGLFHLGFNMWFLYLIGCNMEDVWGRRNFLIFYVGAGVFASIVHGLVNFGSELPAIGASGAVAGVMGAFMIRNYRTNLRIFYAIPPFYPPFSGTFFLPAWIFFAFWFLKEVLYGVGSLSHATGVGHWAHIGGFAGGVTTALILGRGGFEKRVIAPKLEEDIEAVRIPALMELAFKERDQGNLDRAQQLLGELLIQQPQNVDAYRELGNIHLAMDDRQGAADAFGKVIGLSIKNGQEDVAVQTYYEMLFQKLSLKMSPENLYSLAGVLGRNERLNDSLDLYQRLLRESPESELAPRAILRCAEIFREMGSYQLAMSAYEHLLARYKEIDWKDLVRSEMRSLERKMYGH